MCTAFLAISDKEIVICFNRDEFYKRETMPAHVWDSGIIAGRDVVGKGTWLGVHPSGRFALLTNYRDRSLHKAGLDLSRGGIVSDFVESSKSPEQYIKKITQQRNKLNHFNLIVSDGKTTVYYSSVRNISMKLANGFYGLSNGFLDEDWYKVSAGRKRFKRIIEARSDDHGMDEYIFNLFSMMRDSKKIYNPWRLPKTGEYYPIEIMLSSLFINNFWVGYGTRSTSVVTINESLVSFSENSYDRCGKKINSVQIKEERTEQRFKTKL